jgi:hypothetical protein
VEPERDSHPHQGLPRSDRVGVGVGVGVGVRVPPHDRNSTSSITSSGIADIALPCVPLRRSASRVRSPSSPSESRAAYHLRASVCTWVRPSKTQTSPGMKGVPEEVMKVRVMSPTGRGG